MKTLVLLHGWGMTPAVFDTLARRLQGAFDVRAMALPGYCGAAEAPACTIDALAAAVAARAPDRCLVAGWSLGALVALRWALLRPDQVEALALIGATPSFVRREGWEHAVAASVFDAFAVSLEERREATLLRFASLQAQGERSPKAVALRLREWLCRDDDASAATLQQGLRVLLDTDLRDALGDVAQHTLVIHGVSDALAPLAAGDHLARSIPRARLTRIEGAAHAPFVKQSDAVAGAIEDFVR